MLIDYGSTLKNLRIYKQMTQLQVCKDIISRQSYSKIEKNEHTPNTEIFFLLLERMDLTLVDFVHEYEKTHTSTVTYQLFTKGLSNNLTNNQALKLLSELEKLKNSSERFFHLFYLTKLHLSQKNPTVIEKLNADDKQLISTRIKKIGASPSYYELVMFADFASFCLPYEDLIYCFNQIPKDIPGHRSEVSILYKNEINKIYNNVCDVAISNYDVSTAKKILKEYKGYLQTQSDLRHRIYAKINEISIDYLETNNSKALMTLLDIAKIADVLEDSSLAQAIRYQHNSLLKMEPHDPSESITFA